jgi:hypothetical protein
MHPARATVINKHTHVVLMVEFLLGLAFACMQATNGKVGRAIKTI